MYPTVSRIVHYTNLGDADGKYPPEQQAALITKVSGVEDPHGHKHTCTETCAKVSLCIFYPTGFFFMQDVPFSETYKRGHWTWPPKV